MPAIGETVPLNQVMGEPSGQPIPVGSTVPLASIEREESLDATGAPIRDIDILREAKRYGADFATVKAALSGTPVPNATPVNPAAGGMYDYPVIGPAAQGVSLAGMQLASLVGLEDRDPAQRAIAQYRQGAEANNPSMVASGVRAMSEGLTLAAPTMAAGGPVGAAVVGAGLFGGTAYDRAVYEAQQANLSPKDANRYIAAVTGVNAVAGLVPGFAGAGGKAAAKAVGKGAVAGAVTAGGELTARSAFDVNAPEAWSDGAKEVLLSAAMGGAFTLPASLRASVSKGNALAKARALRLIAKQARADKNAAVEVEATVRPVLALEYQERLGLPAPQEAIPLGAPFIPSGDPIPLTNGRVDPIDAPITTSNEPPPPAPPSWPRINIEPMTPAPQRPEGAPLYLDRQGIPQAPSDAPVTSQAPSAPSAPRLPVRQRTMADLPEAQQAALRELRQQNPQGGVTTAQVKAITGGTRESVKALRDEVNTFPVFVPGGPQTLRGDEAAQPGLRQMPTSPTMQEYTSTTPQPARGWFTDPAGTPTLPPTPADPRGLTRQGGAQPGLTQMRRPYTMEGVPDEVQMQGQGRTEEVAQTQPDPRTPNAPDANSLPAAEVPEARGGAESIEPQQVALFANSETRTKEDLRAEFKAAEAAINSNLDRTVKDLQSRMKKRMTKREKAPLDEAYREATAKTRDELSRLSYEFYQATLKTPEAQEQSAKYAAQKNARDTESATNEQKRTEDSLTEIHEKVQGLGGYDAVIAGIDANIRKEEGNLKRASEANRWKYEAGIASFKKKLELVEQAKLFHDAPATPQPAPTSTTTTPTFSRPQTGVQRVTLGNESLDVVKVADGYEVRTQSGKLAEKFEKAGEAKRWAAEELKTNAPDLDDPRSGAVDLSALAELPGAIAQKGKEALGAIGRSAKRNLTSAGDMPVEAFDRYLKAGALKNVISSNGQDLLLDMQRFAKQEGVKDMQAVDAYIKGDVTVPLPPKTKASADRMRNYLDKISQHMVDRGIVTGDMAATFKNNIGTWTRRSYRVFDEGRDWVDTVKQDPKAWGAAVDDVASTRNLPRQQAEGELLALLEQYANGANGGKFGAISNPKGAMDIGSLTRRKDISPAIRAVMGEYVDPTVNFARSVETMADMMANDGFMRDVRKMGLQAGWLKTAPDATHNVAIASEGNRRMKPLTEGQPLYTTREIADSFQQRFSNDKDAHPAMRGYRMANTMARSAATSLSIPSQARNFISGPLLVARLGVDLKGVLTGDLVKDMAMATNVVARKPIEQIKFAMDKNGYSPTDKNVSAYRKEALRLRQLGILDTDVSMGILRDNFRDAMGAGTPGGNAKSKVRQAFNAAGSVYQAGDNFWKTVAYYNLKRLHEPLKAERGWADAQLEEHVAKIIRDEVPNYNMLGNFVRSTKDLPVRPDFIAWPAERLRNTANTFSRIKQGLLSGSAVERNIALNSLGSIISMMAAPAAMSWASMHHADMDEEKDEAFRRTFAYDWQKNSPLFYMNGDDGAIRYVDGSFTDVDAAMSEPAFALLQGKDWTDSFLRLGNQIMADYGDPGIFTGAVIDLTRNKTEQGWPVWLEGDTLTNRAMDSAAHLAKPLVPGTLKQLERVRKGITGEEQRGRTFNAGDEAMAFGGVRSYNMDIPKVTTRVMRDKKNDLTQQTRIYNENIENRGTDPQAAFEQYSEARTAVMSEMIQAYQDALTLVSTGKGESKKVDPALKRKIDQSLKEAGLSRAELYQITTGRISPVQPPKPRK